MALPIGPRGGGGTQPTQPSTPSYGGSTGGSRGGAPSFGGYGQRRGRQPQMGDDGIIIRRPDPGQPPVVGGQHPQPPGGEDGLFDLPSIFPGMPPGFGNFPIAPPNPPGGHGQLPRVPFHDNLTTPGSSGPLQNPYGGIEGFENWGREAAINNPNIPWYLRRHGMRDNTGDYGRGMQVTPGHGGYPTLETVQGISNAMQHPMRTPTRGRGNGQGSAISGYEDQLKRLLADRMGFGGGE